MSEHLTRLAQETLDSTSVGAPVEYRILMPAGHDRSESLPLVLHLHGAGSSSASLEAARPLYEELWAQQELPRCIVVCPSTPTQGGFYLDRAGAEWGTLVAQELPRHIAALHGSATALAIIGASMGGYGALKAAFAAPESFAAVAAISPAVFPGETPDEVPGVNIPSVLGDLHDAMSAGTRDPQTYAGNSVYGLARRNSEQITLSQLPILIDCGAEDEFRLYEGAQFLHELLTELGIRHSFRLVDGAGHMGPSSVVRTKEAIRFIGRSLTGASLSLPGDRDDAPPAS